MNKKHKFKPGQGKTSQQYQDSTRLAWYGVVGMVIILLLVMMLSGCMGTYYISDSEYSDVRESHASLTYYDNQIYWGWYSGYYYYYGKPHYYPWYYYYNTCPPSHYNTTTHVIISRPVNRPTHRPNIKVKTNTHRNTNFKTNVNRNKVIIKSNRSNNSNKRSTNTRRRPK